MRTTVKNLIIIVSAIVAPIILIFSLSAFMYKDVMGSRTEIFEKIKGYVDENILPVLKPLRVELDEKLTSEEKATIEELRAQLSVLIEKNSPVMEKFCPESVDNQSEPTAEELKAMRDAQKQMRTIITKAWAITDNHDVEFENINNQLLTHHEQWSKGIFSIIKEFIPAPMPGKHGMGKAHKGHFPMAEGFVTPVMFILWEPETNFPLNIMEEKIRLHLSKAQEVKSEKKNKLEWSISPNPASDFCKVDFTLSEKSKVTINLINKNTGLTEWSKDIDYEAGTYTEEISLAGKNNGAYIVEIRDGKKNYSKKLIVK